MMDGTRRRLLALGTPLVLGVTLGVAAQMEVAPGPGAPAGPSGTVSTPVRATAVTGATMVELPRSATPATPVEQARTGSAPAPEPSPAGSG
ncbi:hypothetical protein WIS52_29400 [Pseudonocardia nematodicida]|uniref:Uncharacterized protein n=1 Tax=Pseudonocardia nematodicida TaxID=1206997 RepID=A0ABV1KLJ0_9PSEU